MKPDLPPHLAALAEPVSEAPDAAAHAPDAAAHAPDAAADDPWSAQGRARSADEALPADPLEAAVALRRAQRAAALCTVIASSGSSPRKAGAKMLVIDDGRTVGTVGGGAIEQAVVEQARVALARGVPETLEQHLTHDLGMCCGGKMSIFIEPLIPAPPLLIFGAGHVAQPLCVVAAAAGFAVTVIDARADWATRDRFPDAQAVRCAEPLSALTGLIVDPARASAVIVTHDHGLDEAILTRLLEGPPLAYLGVIGSIRKRERFRQRLRARGLDEATLARFCTPMGLDIGAVSPGEIAVSVVAEVIQARQGRQGAAAPMRSLGKGHRPRQHEGPQRPSAEDAG